MLFTLKKKQLKRLKQFVVGFVLIYVLMVSALYLLQEKMIFRPATLDPEYVFKFEQPFEELFLKTDKEETIINALHFKVDTPKGIILYFHGNANNLSRWGVIASEFTKYNYDVLVMDYRTYGKSTGILNEDGLYSDAQYCYKYLVGLGYSNIIVYGRSLGTAMALNVAGNNKISHVILETPFYSIVDVAKKRFPVFPVEKLIKYHFPNFESISKVSSAITIIHGTNDRVVPIKSAIKLLEAAPKQTDFITVKKASHNNLSNFDIYWQSMDVILGK